MQALVQRVSASGIPTLSLETLPKPQPGPNELLVKISHVAQNPTDVNALDTKRFNHEAVVLGCDFVGTVEETGNTVTRTKKGDIVAGLIRGGEAPTLGAYATYTIAQERISFKVPASISPASASTVPLAAATAWLALFSPDSLAIPPAAPSSSSRSILIWGGASSVALYAIQIARLHSLTVITTCSAKNFPLVRSLGATHVFDYHDADVVSKIRAVEPSLSFVFDTIGNEESAKVASQALKKGEGEEGGGALCTVRPGKLFTQDVKPGTKVVDVLVWTAVLREYRYGEDVWPPSKADHDLACKLFDKLPRWLQDGTIKPNEPRVKKGLESVEEGFQEHRDKKVSAYKIVYEV